MIIHELQQSDENTEQGLQYMIQAADAGDRGSMLFMAKAFETGIGLSSNRYENYDHNANNFKQG